MNLKTFKQPTREQRGNAGTFPRTPLSPYLEKSCLYVCITCSEHVRRFGRKRSDTTPTRERSRAFPRFDHTK
jgi:hypothetical protein